MLHRNTLKYSCTFLRPQRKLCSTRDELLLEVNTRKKRWYINGMMSKDDRIQKYYANMDSNVNNLILPFVEDRSWTLLHGARSSGKSTLVDVTKESLQKMGYDVIYVDFQSVVLHKGKDAFWSSFGEDVNTSYPKLSFSNMNGFKRIFAKSTKLLPRPTVLIIDEFSDLYAKADLATKDSLLGVLRSMKQNKTIHNLDSFLGVGTFSITQLIGSTGSPFSVSDSIECPTLSLNEVSKLFKEYSSDSRRKIDQVIIDDIWDRTRGHVGSVSFLGRCIAEHPSIRSIKHLTTIEWYNFVNNHLLQAMEQWVPMKKLTQTLSYPFTRSETNFDLQLIEQALVYLWDFFMYSTDIIEVTEEMVHFCQFLTAEGVLRFCGDYNYQVKFTLCNLM